MARQVANTVELCTPPRSLREGIALARGQGPAANKPLTSLHDDARKHGDVLRELQAHGMGDTAGLANRI